MNEWVNLHLIGGYDGLAASKCLWGIQWYYLDIVEIYNLPWYLGFLFSRGFTSFFVVFHGENEFFLTRRWIQETWFSSIKPRIQWRFIGFPTQLWRTFTTKTYLSWNWMDVHGHFSLFLSTWWVYSNQDSLLRFESSGFHHVVSNFFIQYHPPNNLDLDAFTVTIGIQKMNRSQ